MSHIATAIPGSETVPADKIEDVLSLHTSIKHAIDYGNYIRMGHSFYVNYQPGNGTKYEMVITPLGSIREHVKYPDESALNSRFQSSDLLVSLVNFRTCAVLTTHSDPHYIAEKLNIGLPDAAAISFLLKGEA